jgi:cytochrome c oxidase cbb3-type subunit 1
MSATSSSAVSSSTKVTSREIEQVDRALIDASARLPVLFFYTSAIAWLLFATLLGLIWTLKLQWPDLLGGFSFLTYGRITPVYLNSLAYGWGCQVAFGTCIWLIARLCRVSLRRPGLLLYGGLFWNIGVTLGNLDVLTGGNLGYVWLEYPRYVAAILFVGYSLVAAWAFVMFRLRRPGHFYITLWYLLAAFLWFPWSYGAANLLLNVYGMQGVMQAVVNAMYAQNFMGLWFMSIALGAIYYFIPKVLGRPVHGYHLAALGFWSFAIVCNWTAMTRLNGGPVPAWMVTVSIAANILMLVPVSTVTLNYASTMQGRYYMVYHSPTIRFVFFGAIAWTVACVLSSLSSLRVVDRITHFTNFGMGLTHLIVYGCFTMVMFGSMYYIVPRLTGCEWLSAILIRLHFWGAAYGMGTVIVMMLVAGLVQGASTNNPEEPFKTVIDLYSLYMPARLIGMVMLLFAHAGFALHFLAMLLRLGRPSGEPTLFEPLEEKVA